MSSIQKYRFSHLRHISNLKSFRRSWLSFEPEIRKILGPNPTADDILNLGTKLAQVFQSNSTGRTQSGVSSAGTAWECLVLWYFNLVLNGTHVAAIRPHTRFTPPSISNSTAVTIGNTRTNTESDLIVFTIPESDAVGEYDFGTIDAAIASESKHVSVAVVQCKSNWNDNAQVPMLWGLIYASAGSISTNKNVSIGSNGINPASFQSFTYSFVTVPTSRGPFKHNSLAVLRVSALSGGNYWGHPTRNGVAQSVSEFFTANFPNAFRSTVQNSISNNVLKQKDILEKFLTLDF